MRRRLSPTESGLSHLLRDLAVTLTDDGKVVLQAGEHAGIVIDEATGKVTIYGTAVNIVSGEFQLDGVTVDKPGILSRISNEAKKLVDTYGLKRIVKGSAK